MLIIFNKKKNIHSSDISIVICQNLLLKQLLNKNFYVQVSLWETVNVSMIAMRASSDAALSN